ncbi:hypothetical protein Tco_1008072 [Tanacetum coccineum]
MIKETLPDVRSAYAIISSEESHRVASGSIYKPLRDLRHLHTLLIPTDNGNGRSDESPTLVCEKCGFNGQTIDRCFKFIRYPANLGKKKAGKNFKGKNVSNNVVGSGSSTGFSDEQLSTLLYLLSRKTLLMEKVCRPIWQGVITDSGENQHITFTDKFLVNVIDISHLKIIATLVVPEYYVSLMSVHKVTRDSKLIIDFDELKCYILIKI